MFRCKRQFAKGMSLRYDVIVLVNLKRLFTKNSCYYQGFFAVKRRAVFILGAMWWALVWGWRMGLCGWRHGNLFPMTQSAQSHRQMRSIPLCPKAVFYVFVSVPSGFFHRTAPTCWGGEIKKRKSGVISFFCSRDEGIRTLDLCNVTAAL